MWQGFNQLANAVKEHAESATRDLGLDSQLVCFSSCTHTACVPHFAEPEIASAHHRKMPERWHLACCSMPLLARQIAMVGMPRGRAGTIWKPQMAVPEV